MVFYLLYFSSDGHSFGMLVLCEVTSSPWRLQMEWSSPAVQMGCLSLNAYSPDC